MDSPGVNGLRQLAFSFSCLGRKSFRSDADSSDSVLNAIERENRALVAKAYAALPEGGAFLVIENIIDDARRENAFGLLMSLNMLIETPEGYDYTIGQLREWCVEANFREVMHLPLAGPASAATAWK